MSTNTINIPCGLSGFYKFEKRKVNSSGEEIPGTHEVVLPWFQNLITDIGMNLLGSSPAYTDLLAHCRIGTGNAAPAHADQSLVAQTASTAGGGVGGGSGLSVDGTYIYRRVSKRFSAGATSGVNLAEVGMAPAATGNNLFSRSLLKDLAGNPTTITLLPDEVLDVIYELRLYLPPQDIVVNTTIDGVASTVTIRRATNTQQVNNWAAWLGVVFYPFGAGDSSGYSTYSEYDALENEIAEATGWYNGGTSFKAQRTMLPYTNNSYQSVVQLDWDLTKCNYATGIGFVTIGTSKSTDNRGFNSFGPWGLIFNPKLNKTNERTARVTFGIAWSRHTP